MAQIATRARRDAEALKNALDKLERALEVANENGLLKNDSKTYEEIIDNIIEALLDLSDNSPKPLEVRIIEARKKFSLAHFRFNKIINSTSFWWRFKYSLGGPVLLYLLTMLISMFLAWIFFSSILLDSYILWVPSWAYLWGTIGGILQGLWWLWQHVSNRNLRKNWFVWYTILPFMGAIFGALTYLIFFAGFIVATGESEITSEFFVILLSALAGFSSRWAVQTLNKLTTVIKVGG